MKKILILFLSIIPCIVLAQNKYSLKDVQDFKKGLLLSAQKLNKSVPVRTSENQTLIAVGVTDDVITYKYRIDNWRTNTKLTEEDILQSQFIGGYNIINSQQYLDMFLECLRRTGLHFQILFYSIHKTYIGGYTLTYKDFIDILDTQ